MPKSIGSGPLREQHGTGAPSRRFGLAVEDAIILPVVAVGVVAKALFRWAWSLLVHVVDYLFPLFLQVARFLLFTFRILGDGVSALLRFVINYLPFSLGRRRKWREAVARTWSWLRRKLSYKAFAEFVHHLFEDGMAWVFRTCQRLSPGGALLVILAAIVWIPVSFLAATAVHTWLIAEAASLPAWMQALHVVATVLAKSKLLMLPAYPAAWPQAKKHPIVLAAARAVRFIAGLHIIQRARYRFGQIEDIAARAAAAIGIVRFWQALGAAIDGAAARVDGWTGAALRPVGASLAKVPILRAMVRSYVSHYERAGAAPAMKLSQRVRAFFDHWEIKFTPAYYQAKEREKAAKRKATPTP